MTLTIEGAIAFAEDELLPSANEIDALPVLPRERLDRLAELGYYGLSSPASGIDFAAGRPILEAWSGACLTTTFVWMQHLGVVPACVFGPEHLHPLGEQLASGERRATVAFAGLLPEPKLRCRLEGDEWVVDGMAPWVTGWGLTDCVHAAVRTPEDDIVWLLIDAPDPGMRAEPHHLLALNASATVTVHFDGVRVPATRTTSRFPWSEWPARDAAGLGGNGSLAVGVAARCLRLLGRSSLDAELDRVRDDLVAGTAETLPAARAAASAFAVRAASALLVHEGSRSVDRGTTAERLYREAAMLLVFGSRPTIRRALLEVLG